MALESAQPLTEMSTRNLPVSRLSRKYGNLDVSQTYGPTLSVTGIALPFFFCKTFEVLTKLALLLFREVPGMNPEVGSFDMFFLFIFTYS
jgi:hypothetical protein